MRSRLYLKTQKKNELDDDEDTGDSAVRILEVMKSNYGPAGERVPLVWKDGLLISQAIAAGGAPQPSASMRNASAVQIFLELLRRYERNGLAVSEKPNANNYAPTKFADEPEAKGLEHQGQAKNPARTSDETPLRQGGNLCRRNRPEGTLETHLMHPNSRPAAGLTSALPPMR